MYRVAFLIPTSCKGKQYTKIKLSIKSYKLLVSFATKKESNSLQVFVFSWNQ